MNVETFAAQVRDWQRRERGICSDPECGEPIAGWCATCDALGPFKAPKLCAEHLIRHLAGALPEKHQPYAIPTPGGAA